MLQEACDGPPVLFLLPCSACYASASFHSTLWLPHFFALLYQLLTHQRPISFASFISLLVSLLCFLSTPLILAAVPRAVLYMPPEAFCQPCWERTERYPTRPLPATLHCTNNSRTTRNAYMSCSRLPCCQITAAALDRQERENRKAANSSSRSYAFEDKWMDEAVVGERARWYLF